MEPETITISPVDGKYQFAMNGVQAPQLHDSMGAAARSVWLTLAAAETVIASGPEGERLEPVGSGGRVKALLAARRIPSDDLTKLVLGTLLGAQLVLPPPADENLDSELQDLFRTSTTP